MAFAGFYIYVFVLILSGLREVEQRELRKVIVKEIRFSILPATDREVNVSVKNGVDNDVDTAPDVKLFQPFLLNELSRKEHESTMLNEYYKNVRKDPYLSRRQKGKSKSVTSDVNHYAVDGKSDKLEEKNYKIPIQTSKISQNGKDVNTNAPKITETTEVNGKDVNTNAPKITEITEVNGKDVNTNAPKITEITEVNGKDVNTNAPKITETTEVNGKDVNTNAPKITETTEVNGDTHAEGIDHYITHNVSGISENDLGDSVRTFEGEAVQKIVGGSLSIPSHWPWQASIQYFGTDGYWHHFCGGSLINQRWVITAAHCVCKLEEYIIRVVLGDYRLSVRTNNREQVIDPSRILVHGYYEENSYYFDTAMVKLAESARYTSYVQSIDMASPETDTFTESDLCYITGWGNTIGTTDRIYVSDYLMQGRVRVISETSCRKTYGNIIEDTQICVQGDHASACSGDSGGPLVCHVENAWKLAGVASWVGSTTCSAEYPNVYTRMCAFSEWTESLMAQY